MIDRGEDDKALWLTAPDAEHAVANWMRSVGFSAVRVSQASGDGGIDVWADEAVAQVKASVAPTGRPALQALVGAASIESRVPLFFSAAGYTKEALAWADRASLALFKFDRLGRVIAVNSEARSRALAPMPAASNNVGKSIWLRTQRSNPQASRSDSNGRKITLSDRPCSFACADHGFLYASVSKRAYDPSSVELQVFDLETGTRVDGWWNQLPDLDSQPIFPPSIADGRAVISDSQCAIRVDLDSLEVEWQESLLRHPIAPCFLQSDMYLVPGMWLASDGSGLCLDGYELHNGALRWTVKLGSFGPGGIDCVLAHDGILVVGFAGFVSHGFGGAWDTATPGFGSVVAIDLESGDIVWSIQDFNVQAMANFGDMLVLAGAQRSPFECAVLTLDLVTGVETSRWSLSRDPSQWVPMRIVADERGCYLCTHAGVVHIGLTSWLSQDFDSHLFPFGDWILSATKDEPGILLSARDGSVFQGTRSYDGYSSIVSFDSASGTVVNEVFFPGWPPSRILSSLGYISWASLDGAYSLR